GSDTKQSRRASWLKSIWVESSFGRYEVMDGSSLSMKRLVLPALAGLPRAGPFPLWREGRVGFYLVEPCRAAAYH
ncbi:MAG: hypothetical protein LW870_24190, partial [Pirellula sp.]|nr:hypothetical protein [Pirellula sp.]